MHTLACSDLGISPTCGFKASGETADEAVDKEIAHAHGAHAKELEEMGLDDSELRATAAVKVREGGAGADETPAAEDDAAEPAAADDEEETE